MIIIKPIDFNDSKLLESLSELISLSFEQDKPEIKNLEKNIFCEESSLRSLVLGAFDQVYLRFGSHKTLKTRGGGSVKMPPKFVLYGETYLGRSWLNLGALRPEVHLMSVSNSI